MAFTKINAAGIGTTETVTVDGLTVINDGSFGGNLTVGGVLTYEDVTNVDSVGLITARNGIVVGSGITLSKDGDIFATGITTISENLKVGTGVTISPDGDGFFTGVITATSYSGIDLSDVTGATGDFSIADKIVHTGDTNTAIRFPAADTITAETNGSERARIDSSGRLLLGTTTSAAHTNADDIVIAKAGKVGLTINSTDSDASHIYFADSSSNPGTYAGYFEFHHGTDTLKYGTGNDQRFQVDSSGRFMIGTTTEGQENADDLTVAGSSNSGITIRSGTSSFGQLFFSDGTSGDDEYRGIVGYSHADNFMKFHTNAVERLRIDSTGRISAGKHGVGTYNDASEWFKVQSDDTAANISIVGSNNTHSSLNMGDEDDFNIQKIKSDHTDNSLQFYTDNTEKARIDSTGIFESNSSFSATYSTTTSITPHLRSRNPNGTDNIYGGIQLRADRGNGAAAIFNIACLNSSTSYESTLIFQSRNTDGNFSEKMRIDPIGRLLHGCTSATGGISEGQITIEFAGNSRNAIKTRDLNNNSTVNHMVFCSGSAAVGTITGTTGQAFFNNLSDYRSKENDVKITDGIEKIKLLRPIRFNYKVDKDTLCDGFFAHEVAAAVPTAVTGEKDGMAKIRYEEGDTIPDGKKIGDIKEYSTTEIEPQMLDTGKIIPLLTAALQESITKIETLEAEVAALKSS